MTGKPSAARKATLGAIQAALAFLALLAAAMVPTGKMGAYFLSCVFVAGVTCEDLPLTSFLAFLATAALGWFLLPDKLALILYVGFFGWYGVARYLLERRFHGLWLWVFKLLVCNAAAALTGLGVVYLLGFAFTTTFTIPLWAVILALQGAFIGGDLLYTLVANYYVRVIRPRVFAARR